MDLRACVILKSTRLFDACHKWSDLLDSAFPEHWLETMIHGTQEIQDVLKFTFVNLSTLPNTTFVNRQVHKLVVKTLLFLVNKAKTKLDTHTRQCETNDEIEACHIRRESLNALVLKIVRLFELFQSR